MPEMNVATYTTVRLVRAVQEVRLRRWSFFAVFTLVFVASVTTLASLDLLPERISAPLTVAIAASPEITLSVSPILSAPETPIRIVIPVLGLDTTIANPHSADIKVLDAELLKGAVRYPTSARLGENGNVVVFGHSSYLPIVHNQAFKVFDGIQDLQVGETITVYSSDKFYTYVVVRVEKVKAESGVIPLKVSGRVLTLATCDSFGTKSDRFVVSAEFVRSEVVSS